MKIVHGSDVHVKLLKQHKEYEIIFQEFYKKLKEIQPDIVVLTGDIFHNKVNLSPEAVKMASGFFKSIADIAPLYIIAR